MVVTFSLAFVSTSASHVLGYDLGPAHSDDISLIFPGSLPPERTDNDKNMAKSLVEIWESFIKTG